MNSVSYTHLDVYKRQLHIIAYTLVRAALYGGRTAIIEIPALTFQTGAGIVIGFVIYMLLKKSGVAGRLSGMLG